MPATETNTHELTSAIETLREMIQAEELERRQPSGPATVYTTMVTIWMMTMQRLGGGKSLNAIVKDVLAHSRDLLPNNRRLREGTLSETSGAYAEARSRLELETVEFFANGKSLGTATLSNRSATLTIKDLSFGSQTITATYSGDANWLGTSTLFGSVQSLANKPAPKIAILTCMDPRLNQLLEWLDIKPADADVRGPTGHPATCLANRCIPRPTAAAAPAPRPVRTCRTWRLR